MELFQKQSTKHAVSTKCGLKSHCGESLVSPDTHLNEPVWNEIRFLWFLAMLYQIALIILNISQPHQIASLTSSILNP